MARWWTVAAVMAAAVIGAARAEGAPFSDLGYPRLAAYASIGRGPNAWGWDTRPGWPVLNRDLSVNMDVIRACARFDLIVWDAGRLSERPDLADSLRAQETGTLIVGLVGAAAYWNPDHVLTWPDTTRSVDRLIYRRVRGSTSRWYTVGHCGFFDGFNGPHCETPWAFNWTMLNWGERAVADAFASAVAQYVRPPLFDGVFVDLWYARYWMNGGRDTLNLRAMGWAGSQASYDSSMLANHIRATRTISSRVPYLGVNQVVPEEEAWHGSMRENWPRQLGGTWESNMVGPSNVAADSGYLGDGEGSWLNVMLTPECGDTPERARIVRYSLASATLGEGFASWTCVNDRPASDDRAQYYPDEAAVDRETGRPSRRAQDRHWLGHACGPAYRWSGGAWRRDFEYGIDLVNPTAAPVAVRLETWYERIAGSGWPNTGGSVMYLTLPPNDGLFLMRARR